MKLISIKKTGHRDYTIAGNDYFIAGLVVFILMFIVISFAAWNIYTGLLWAGTTAAIITPIILVKDKLGAKKHLSINQSKLFNALKKSTFRSEKIGDYEGLINTINGRTIRIYYDWNKLAKGNLSFGDLVITLFYEPLIEKSNDFEIKEKEIKALNTRHKSGYSDKHWQQFTIDRMFLRINYYPWTKMSTLMSRIDQSITTLENENLAPFDINNLNGRFKKQDEDGFFMPRMDMIRDEIKRRNNANKVNMKTVFLIAILLVKMSYSFGQEKFKIIFQNDDYNTHYIANENDSIIKKLDSIYLLTFQPETLGYFHVFIIQGKNGWCAIDANESILFKVYNTEIGTPSPDELIDGLIRIEKDSLIGFANEKAEIVIPPKYEIATSFKNGFAIIGGGCENIPWGNDHSEHDCQHYTTICSRHGYIDTEGNIIEFGEFTFEEIEKMVK